MNLTVAAMLGIDHRQIQRSDLLNFIKEHEIKRINFCYTGGDGRLKELILPVNSLSYAERILAAGERVDGSSLFKGMVGTESSDLYVVPQYSSAFLNPFDDKCINLICRFLNKEEGLANFCPDNILKSAITRFRESYHHDIWALGELEFYLIGDIVSDSYPLKQQEGYHASSPFIKYGEVIKEMVEIIADITGHVKYGHSEVGVIHSLESPDPHLNGKYAEQYEIEFLPAPIEKAADYLILAKWVIRNVADIHGLQASFAPKLENSTAGTGLHFHLELLKDDVNQMTDPDGELSDLAREMIGGILNFAGLLSAFGNAVPSSYLRLVPGQESPTRLFWSDLNRSALIRVPLGWRKGEDMASIINHRLKDRYISPFKRQTIEIRSADGSAHIHLFLTVIVAATFMGLAEPEQSLKIANDRQLKKGDDASGIPELPANCAEAAEELSSHRMLLDGWILEHLLDWLIEDLTGRHSQQMEVWSELDEAQRAEHALKVMHSVIDVG